MALHCLALHSFGEAPENQALKPGEPSPGWFFEDYSRNPEESSGNL